MFTANRLTKLAGLLIKTFAKPVSKRIKHDFSRFDVTKRMLINIGQTSHWMTSWMTIRSSGYRVRSISPLDPEKALKNGAELLGETFTFLVSGGIVVFEYNRSQTKAAKKEMERRAKVKAEQAALQAKLHTLDIRLKAVEDVVRQNEQSILNLRGGKYVEPSPQELVPIDDHTNENEEEQQQETTQQSSTMETANSASTPSQPPSKPWWKVW